MIARPVLALMLAGGAAGGYAVTPSQPARSASPAAPAASVEAPLLLGVGTHFAQGWLPALAARVGDAHAASVRDTVPWEWAESAPGRYDFTVKGASGLDAICRSPAKLLLMINPRNPRYDGGQAVHSPEGIAAYAAYVRAVADHFGSCLAGVEIGNEINDPHNLPYPVGVDPAAAYVSTVRAVRATLTGRKPRVVVVAGDTNAVGTGFLDKLFAAGLLNAADAISVHPYRSQAENVDVELDHLRQTMRHHGRELPIWATEFSDNYQTPTLAADELVKAVTLMASAGVAQAYWYALIDQPWFHNMGLYSPDGRTKPAALAFRRMKDLAAEGRPVRVSLSDSGIRLYRFGKASFVLWGAGGSVAFAGAAKVTDAAGGAATPSGTDGVLVKAAPVIVSDAGAPRLVRPSDVMADSLFGYARAPWSYLARTRDGDHPLAMIDSNWASYFGSPYLQPLSIFDQSATPAGSGADPQRVVIRYTPPAPQQLSLSACFHKNPKGDGVDLAITAGGRVVWKQLLTRDTLATGVDVDVAPGRALDIVAGPNQAFGDDDFTYRVRLFRRGSARPTPCPQRPFEAS